MKKFSALRLISAWMLLALLSPAPDASAQPGGAIERLDPRFDALVPQEARLEKLADGFTWVEGPVWDAAEGALLFSDIPHNAVYRWQESEGVSLFLRPSGYTGEAPFAGHEPGANGLTFDAEGRLVLAQHGDRRIARLKPDGSYTTLADRYQGKRFNSPNDVVFHANGDLYFTDPPYGLPEAFVDPARELAFTGVYRLTPPGTLTLLEENLSAPNGLAFSPDQRTLYIANSDPERAIWMAYDVQDDGTLANGRLFYEATNRVGPENPGLPDGLKLDRAGNLFATGPGGLYVFAPDGTLLGRIPMGVPTANVAWGDDGATLYITANTALYRLRLKTTGAGF